MYCNYTYKSGADTLEIANDIDLLIKGETDISKLSKSCDYDLTQLTATASNNWTNTTFNHDMLTKPIDPLTDGVFTYNNPSIGSRPSYLDVYFSAKLNKWIIMWFQSSLYNSIGTTGYDLSTIIPISSFSNSYNNPCVFVDSDLYCICIPNASGTIYYSVNGTTWTTTSQTTNSYGNQYNWVSGASKGSVVVVVSGSSGTQVMYSANSGVSWSSGPKTIPSGSYWGVTANSNIFVAVGSSVCATSIDGITWTARTIPAGAYLSIAWNGSVFCAIGINLCATSPDGVTWTARTLVNASGGKIVASGSTFYVITSNVNSATSSDGITWAYQTSSVVRVFPTYYYNGTPNIRCWDINKSNNQLQVHDPRQNGAASTTYVYNIKHSLSPTTQSLLTSNSSTSGRVQYMNLYYSNRLNKWYEDGLWYQWTGDYRVPIGTTGFDMGTYIAGAGFTNGYNNPGCFVDNGTVLVRLPNYTGTIYYTTDGINWSSATGSIGTQYNWVSAASLGLICVAVSAANGTQTMYSANGTTWSTQATIPSGSYWGVTANSNIFVAVGSSICATSPNGTTWTARTIPAGTYTSVAWNGNVFCAIGANLCATSPDGVTWTARTLVNASGHKILVRGTTFYVITSTTTIRVSTDNGINWVSYTGNFPTGTYVGSNSLYWNYDINVATGVIQYHTGGTTNTIYTFSLPTNYSVTSYKEYQTLLNDGVNYKYATLFYSNTANYISLTTYETVTSNVMINSTPIQNLIFITNSIGGNIKIFCTNYYIGLFNSGSSSSSTLFGGGSSDVFLCEFNRDDLWNIHPYKPVTLLQDKWYVPRLKTDISIDSTGETSYLSDCPEIWDLSGTKQLIDNNGVVYNAQTDVRLVGEQYNKLVYGGKLLGGVKRTTNSLGSKFNEVTINNITYINIPIKTKTYLIPKA